jgi:3-methyl-2-oxobutanoate hydroxymethyltransferase
MNKPLRIPDLQLRKQRGEKLVMLTAYSAWMARLLAASGAVDILLVGDSLGMVELGYDTTLPVSMSDMLRHTRAVRAGAPNALIVADMPFLSHQASTAQALRNAGRLLREGATAVKLEGGAGVASTVHDLVSAGIPVMGHIGLQPQSIHAQGGYRRQATHTDDQRRLLDDATALQAAGAFSVVLECVAPQAAARVTASLRIPTIGIGAGPDCDGQVLVTNDLLGLTPSAPSFVKVYASLGPAIQAAASSYSSDVRSGAFPTQSRKQEAGA